MAAEEDDGAKTLCDVVKATCAIQLNFLIDSGLGRGGGCALRCVLGVRSLGLRKRDILEASNDLGCKLLQAVA